MATLYYQGHGSFRLQCRNGMVIYVDPGKGDGYDLPADLILVTHQHPSHCQVDLVARKPKCEVITEREAQSNGKFNAFTVRGVQVRATPAYNVHHDPRECVGYLITLDGVKLYAAGDTAWADFMNDLLFERLDYALLPVDGEHTMSALEAAMCAARINPRCAIPIHTSMESLYDLRAARCFDVPGRRLVKPGESIKL